MTTSGFQPATLLDMPELHRLRLRFQQDEPFPNPMPLEEQEAVLANLIENPHLGRVWLVAGGDEPVGYFVLSFGFSLEYGGKTALLDEMFLVESARGKGLGRHILDFLADVARQRGCRVLQLEVDLHNERAQRLYASTGFEGLHKRSLLTRWLGSTDGA